MSDMTYMQSNELQTFADSLEVFMSKIDSHCTEMENGIAAGSLYMLDEVSKQALTDVSLLCADIRSLLNPSKLVLEKVLDMIEKLKEGEAELGL